MLGQVPWRAVVKSQWDQGLRRKACGIMPRGGSLSYEGTSLSKACKKGEWEEWRKEEGGRDFRSQLWWNNKQALDLTSCRKKKTN